MYVYLQRYIESSDLWLVLVESGAVSFKAYLTNDGVAELDATRIYLRHSCNLSVACMQRFEEVTGNKHPNLGG